MTDSRTLGLPSGITPEPGDDDQPHNQDPNRGYAVVLLPVRHQTQVRAKASNQQLDQPRSFMDDTEEVTGSIPVSPTR
jgi:hypothetical protein